MAKPYTSRWEEQLKGTMEKILNREPFSYDLNGDALYRQYKDSYIRQGAQAMRDTMGKAAALTGGYGNSYAQSAGQQAYHGYLQQLSDRIPQLHAQALSRYQTEDSRLRGNAALLQQQEAADYNRYRTGLADQNDAFDRLLALMTGYGYQPSTEEMAMAGMTQAHLNAILGLNKPAAVKSSRGNSVYDSAVFNIQNDLNKAGAKLNTDGVYGKKTDAALQEYINQQSGEDVEALAFLQQQLREKYKHMLGY